MPMSVATAFSASGPTARTVTCCPLLAPSCITDSTLFASTSAPPPTASCTADETCAAATDSAPAGRACRSPVRVIVASQFSGIARLLRGVEDGLEAAARGGGDRGGDRALDERGVRHLKRPGKVVKLISQQRPHGQHGAAQVRQDHHAGPGVRPPNRQRDLVDAGPQAAVVGPARGGNGDRSSADLASELSGALRERGTVGSEDDTYPCSHGLCPILSLFDITEKDSMIQSVERAAAILAALGSGTPRLGVTEIAERVGLAKPTTHGLLRALVAHDLVAQDPASGKYSLGAGVLQLGNAYLDGSELRARSLLWAESLAQRTNEAVWVATLSGTRVIVLHHVFRPDNTVQILEVGAAIPWYACALGHSIVAYLPAGEAARLMVQERAALTGRTKTTRSALGQALAQVRRRGYAVEDQEATVGDAGIAGPIVGRDGVVAGAIGVVGPAGRILDHTAQ